MNPSDPGPSDPSRMRASDSDRDRVADQLREALAEGRLTPEEHAERIEAVYAAKTYAELAPVIEDLPATGGTQAPLAGAEPGQPAPPHQSANLVGVFSGVNRTGRWLVEPSTNVLTVFGGFVLDLRQAVLSQREVTINIVAVCGGGTIKVPPGVRVANSVASIVSGVTIPPDDTDDPNAPVVRLTGMAILSGIDVERKRAGRAGGARSNTPDPDRPAVADDDRRQLSRDRHREHWERHRELQESHQERQRDRQRRHREDRNRRRGR